MAVPNRIDLVQSAAARWPAEFAACGTGGTAGHAFIKKLAAFMAQQTIGTPEEGKWGNNGKRGNVHDLSDDSIAYRGAGVAIDVVNGGPMEIIDIAANAGLPNIAAAWQPALAGPGDRGAYVAPDMAELGDGGTTQPPTTGSGWTPAHSALLARFPAQTSPSAAFVRKVAEQFAFSFPGEWWGHKMASPGRPPSTDVMARSSAAGLVGHRIIPQSGAATAIALPGQVFIFVTPTNHLGVTGPGPTPIPGPTPGGDVPYPGADESIWDRVGEQLFADFSAHGEAPNPGMFRWSARICWEAANSIKRGQAPVSAIQAAIEKYRGEWLAVLSRPRA